MTLLVWIIFGALVGWLASLLMGTQYRQGLLSNILVGVIGAFIGGFVFNSFGAAGVTGFNLYSFVVAIVGAALLLFIARAVR